MIWLEIMNLFYLNVDGVLNALIYKNILDVVKHANAIEMFIFVTIQIVFCVIVRAKKNYYSCGPILF